MLNHNFKIVGRKLVICSVCNKEKLNFGFNKCSACLRNWKRKNKPSFYLGTCYSEISRRTKTFLKTHPNYYGLEKCTREEFISKFKNDRNFLKQWNIWKENDFKRGFAPSIDRIDSNKGYTLDNLQFLSNIENARKEFGYPVKLKYNDTEVIFDSYQLAANFLKITSGSFSYYAKKGEYKNWKIINL